MVKKSDKDYYIFLAIPPEFEKDAKYFPENTIRVSDFLAVVTF